MEVARRCHAQGRLAPLYVPDDVCLAGEVVYVPTALQVDPKRALGQASYLVHERLCLGAADRAGHREDNRLGRLCAPRLVARDDTAG